METVIVQPSPAPSVPISATRDPRSFVAPEVWERQIKLLVRDHPFDTVMAERLFGQAVAYLITAMEKQGQKLEIGCGPLVDTAVHNFILDTANYRAFCFEQRDAVAHLTEVDRSWDAIYSIWGALWFTDPRKLLPAVFHRLTPGGRLVFSHAPAVPGCYGIQGMYANGFTGRQVWVYRWAYEPDTWTDILHGHGFTDVTARVHPAPNPGHVGTLIVTASRPSP